MGSYGEVCVTFNLEYDATLAGGKVYDEGLGFPQDVCASGKVTNYWRIDGVVTVRHVAHLADDTQNLDMVTLTSLNKELIVGASVLQ